MPFYRIPNFRTAQWQRGLRAGLAVTTATLLCQYFGKSSGWVALGALQVLMVDNGGPYLSRVANIATVLVGGSIAVMLGILAGVSLSHAIVVTLVVCFAFTLARVISQPFASSSVIILVCYVVAYGATNHGFHDGLTSALYFTIGGLWAALVTLVLWPTDPFTPARLAVADVYVTLGEVVQALPSTDLPAGLTHFNEAIARFRMNAELAHEAIAATPARMTSRTVRARNLSAMVETADLLLARLLRFAELSTSQTVESHQHLREISTWLSVAIAPIEPALRERPADRAAAFLPEGTYSTALRDDMPQIESGFISAETALHLSSALRDARLSIEIAYEALHAVWSGAEQLRTRAAQFRASLIGSARGTATPMLWVESLRSNLTIRSVMFRHALRLAIVVTLDVVLMHMFRVTFTKYTHGYWLAMTSLIVLQPYTGETVRRSGERVLGTVAGALVAACVTAVVSTELGILITIGIGTVFLVAFYTVDYALYCFFLTPTIVLMTLPHLHDWHYAGVRMLMTVGGALIAVLAMLLLWPERESLQLPALLASGASADAAYLRAVLTFWKNTRNAAAGNRMESERILLAPARRACGLAANSAEDALDHALLEHALPLNPQRSSTERLNAASLTFTTYLRRITQTVTTFAAVGEASEETNTLVAALAVRLDGVAAALANGTVADEVPVSGLIEALPDTLSGQQLRRIERQIAVLERTTGELANKS